MPDTNAGTEHSPRGAQRHKGNGTIPRTIDESALEGGPEIAEKRMSFPDLEAALCLDDYPTRGSGVRRRCGSLDLRQSIAVRPK
jgi:hypothetical protein